MMNTTAFQTLYDAFDKLADQYGNEARALAANFQSRVEVIAKQLEESEDLTPEAKTFIMQNFMTKMEAIG